MNEYYANVTRAEERAERIKRQVWQHRAAACCKTHKPVYAPTYVAETHRNLRFAVALGAMTLLLLVIVAPANAQQHFEQGQPEAFYDAMLALRLGNYYYVSGDYETALGYMEAAVSALPDSAFTADGCYAHFYLYLSRVQYAVGDTTAAHHSLAMYHQYLGEQIQPADAAFAAMSR